MKYLATILVAAEKSEEITDMRKDLNWEVAGATLGWFNVVADVVTGQWLGAIVGVGGAIIETRNPLEEASRLRKAELRYNQLLLAGVIMGVISIIIFAVKGLSTSQKIKKLKAEIQKLRLINQALLAEKQKELSLRRKSWGIALGLAIFTTVFLVLGTWSHAGLTNITTDYVQSKMGKDAELVKLRQVQRKNRNLFYLSHIVVFADYRYQDNGVREKINSSWELDLNLLDWKIDSHRMVRSD
jgi:hypothetical protein